MKTLISLPLVGSCLILAACSDDTEIVEVPVEVIVEVPVEPPAPVDVSYQITVTNLTHAQPLSPVAVVVHEAGNLWQVGEVASLELERMAEGGDNSGLIGLGGILGSSSGAGLIMPGMSETINVTVQDVTDAKLSVATMLVNTNDAFSGLNAWDLAQLEVDQSWMTQLMVYDAGTETNTEGAGTMPGQGGAGFDATRDDVGFVAHHPGVVTADDGLLSSVLNGQHKFDNPAIRIQITRTE